MKSRRKARKLKPEEGSISHRVQRLAKYRFLKFFHISFHYVIEDVVSIIKTLGTDSSAHTIGVSHCSTISNCLYNFTGKLDQDPALDSESMHKI
ncbi:hypothetical protein AAHE18_14G120600 [Arachis hypogaea]